LNIPVRIDIEANAKREFTEQKLIF